MAHLKEKKINRNCPKEYLMVDLLDKNFKTAVLKISTKGRYGDRHENDIRKK